MNALIFPTNNFYRQRIEFKQKVYIWFYYCNILIELKIHENVINRIDRNENGQL